MDNEVTAMAKEESGFVQTDLKAGALKWPHVIMQSVTQIAPAISVLYSFQFIAQLAGVTSPLAYIISFVIVLILAVNLAELSRTFPSAGGYFTYVSKTLGRLPGFLVGWMYFLYTPLVAGPILVYMGYVLQNTLVQYHIVFPWWVFFVLAFIVTAYIMYRGIELTGSIMLIFGLSEIVIVLALAIWGMFQPGSGGISAKPFNLSLAPSGLGLAVIFTLFGYSGWESAAALGEESENPRKTVPMGLIGSVLVMGVILVFCMWGLEVGWGVNDINGLVKSSELPAIVLAQKFWGIGWLFVMLALINSALAVVIATGTVSTRMWYAMARDGALPKSLGKVHPKHKTPTNALWFQLIVTLIAGLGGAALVGVDQVWYVDGLMLTFALALIYGLASLGLFVYRWKGRHQTDAKFNFLLHGIFPLVTIICLIWLVYQSLVPYPAYPSSLAPIITVVWLVLGFIVIGVIKSRGREDLLLKAGGSSKDLNG
jgi:amino acid transporter